MPFASESARRSVSVPGKLRRLPILPAIAQWVSPVSTNDERCERLRSESLLREESSTLMNKNSSGDEIANVNFFTTISHTYFKTPKREPISFNQLDDS